MGSVAGIVSEFDCAGSRGFARVCAGLRGFARVRVGSRGFARVRAGSRGFARVCAGLRAFARVRAVSPGFALVCAGLMMMIIIFMIIMIIMMMSQWPQQSVPSNVLQAIAEAQVCKIITYAKKQSLSTRAWAKPFQKHFFLMLWHFLASRIHHSSVSTEGGGDFANWIISFNLSTNDLSLKRWNMVLKKHTWSQITGMVESLPSCYLFLLYHHVQVYSFL